LGLGRGISTWVPALGGILMNMHWAPPELFMLAAVPTAIASFAGIGGYIATKRRDAARLEVQAA
jgi:hypothetical protein